MSSLIGSGPAVDRNTGAADERCVRRREEQQHAGDLFRLGPAAEVRWGMLARLAGVSIILGSRALTVTLASRNSSACISARVNTAFFATA